MVSKPLTGPQIGVLDRVIEGWTLHQKLATSSNKNGERVLLLFLKHATDGSFMPTRFRTVRILVELEYLRAREPTLADLDVLNSGGSYQCFELVEAL